MKWLGLGSWDAYQALPVGVQAMAAEMFRDEQERLERMNQR